MKVKDIRSMDIESLKKKLEDLRKDMVKINAQVAIGTTPKNPGQVKAIKKTIAKIITIINEKKSDKIEKTDIKEKMNKKEKNRTTKKEVEKKA